MKILNLKIINNKNELIRDIMFNENGTSYIYGDIQNPKNKRGTTNSLGKTLLLNFINYIYGANEDKLVSKSELKGYRLEAIVKQDGKERNVSRIIGSSKEIFLDGKQKSLTEYKESLNIDRGFYNKQIIISKKSSIISTNTKANKEDNINFMQLLNLSEIIDSIEKIYKSQEKIKRLKNNKSELIDIYDKVNSNKIDEEIYFIEKEVKELEGKIGNITKKIKRIEISDLQNNVVEEYSIKSSELKRIKTTLERIKVERNRLEKFIEDSDKIDIKSEHILAIYNRVKIEIPDIIKRTLEEVEKFHKTVYDERKDSLGKKKNEIDERIKNKEERILNLSKEVDKLGEILSNNQVYQESIALYENFNNKLQDLKFREGKLSQIKEIDKRITEEDTNLVDDFESANSIIHKYTEVIKEYREFIYTMIRDIYDESVSSYFDIKIKKKHQTTRPVDIEFNLKGDTGEGVNEVKKNIIDYLIFKYNNIIELLLQDSACYNGIDPRQVCGLLKSLEKIGLEVNKQSIISINKYQLGDNDDFISDVIENSSIILSEKDKLLKFDF